MKACGMEVYLHSFLTLVLHEYEWLASRSGGFTPGEEPLEPIVWTAGTVWILWGRRQLQMAKRAMWRQTVRMAHVARYTCACARTCTDAITNGRPSQRTLWRNALRAHLLPEFHPSRTWSEDSSVQTPLRPSVTPSVQIFKKLKLAAQRFANNSDTTFHKNPTNGLVADIRSPTDGRTVSCPCQVSNPGFSSP